MTNEKHHLRILPGRKKLKSKMNEKLLESRAEMIPKWKKAQRRGELGGSVDLGSKKYTLEPAITVSLHWPEKIENEIRLQTMVIGTRSFNSAYYLNKTKQNKFNEVADNVEESEKSSTWSPEDEVMEE